MVIGAHSSMAEQPAHNRLGLGSSPGGPTFLLERVHALTRGWAVLGGRGIPRGSMVGGSLEGRGIARGSRVGCSREGRGITRGSFDGSVRNGDGACRVLIDAQRR